MSYFDYADSPVPVRDDLVDAHNRAWNRIANAGTWFDGKTRVAIAAEVRHARGCPLCLEQKAALSPFAVTGEHDTLGDLPEEKVEMIHRIVADPGRLTKSWFDARMQAIPDTEYVETVSIIAHVTAIDTFAHAIGVTQRPLPDAQPGEPTRYRPAEARLNDFWVPNITADEAGENEVDIFQGRQSNIRRAMTLVPDEVRSFFDLGMAQYLGGAAAREFVNKVRAISRAQIELVAGRVSAINQCTY